MQFSKVVIVVEENFGYNDVIGSSSMPYFNSLLAKGALASNFYSNTHPSIGNYFMLTAGQIYTNDDTFNGPVTIDNIVRQIIASGKTWKQYAESIPSVGYLGGDSGLYIHRHAILTYFNDAQASGQVNNIVPFTQFATDLAAHALPNFSFITPNSTDDGHSGSLSAADTFLSNNIPALLADADFAANGLLIILWDEAQDTDSTNGGGHTACLFVGNASKVKQNVKVGTFYQLQNVLSTICDSLSIPNKPGAASSAAVMSDMFVAQASSNPAPVPTLGNRPVSSFSAHNVSGAATYNKNNFPNNFQGKTNRDGSLYTIDATLEDNSENPSAGYPGVPAMVLNKGPYGESLHSLMPPSWSGRVMSIYMGWWGASGHDGISIGVNQYDGPTVAKILQDHKDRGIDVIMYDWYRPNHGGDTSIDDSAVNLGAANMPAGMKFCVDINQHYITSGYWNWNGATTQTQGLIDAINHILTNWAGNPAYERYSGPITALQGRPLIPMWDIPSVTNADWNAVRAAVQGHASGNPLLIQFQTGGFGVTQSDGSFSWIDDKADTAADPSGADSYLGYFLNSGCAKNQGKVCISSVTPGFNGTLTGGINPTSGTNGWSLGKFLDRQAGYTWKHWWDVNKNFVNSGQRLDYVLIVTWDDYEEGSSFQGGIRSDVRISASLNSASQIVTFSLTAGDERVVKAYNLWGSSDGVNATLLATVFPGQTKQFDLTKLTGQYVPGTFTLYVEAQHYAGLQNIMAPQTFPGVQITTPSIVPASSTGPTAVLNVSPQSGIAPLTVTASGASSLGVGLTYQMDFGDGNVVNGSSFQHVYNTPGIYAIKLTVTDSSSRTNSTTKSVTVSATAAPTPPTSGVNPANPVAVLKANPISGLAPLTVQFDGTPSYPGNTGAAILKYLLDYGDGNTQQFITTPGQANPINYQNDIALASGWQVTNQLNDGAIPTGSVIKPYFGNLAARGWLKDVTKYAKVLLWLQWYLNHLNVTDYWGINTGGTIYDYNYASGVTTTPVTSSGHGTADSVDSYAATFLTLCWAAWQTGDVGTVGGNNTGLRGFLTTNKATIDKVANTLYNSLVMDATDGLTWAKPDVANKYTMDNSEVYQGLLSYAQLCTALNDATNAQKANNAAAKIKTSVIATFGTPTANRFPVNKGGSAPNLANFYPDTMAQFYPLLLGIVDPASPMASTIYAALNSAWPGWITLSYMPPESFPHVETGMVAVLMNDFGKANQFLSSLIATYQSQNFPWPWYGAENGWYMTLNAAVIAATNAAQAPYVSHVYSKQGNFLATLTVTDANAATGTSTQQISVTSTIPTLPGAPNTNLPGPPPPPPVVSEPTTTNPLAPTTPVATNPPSPARVLCRRYTDRFKKS